MLNYILTDQLLKRAKEDCTNLMKHHFWSDLFFYFETEARITKYFPKESVSIVRQTVAIYILLLGVDE